MTGRRPSQDGKSTREQRLADALRANLRRRKAAARVRPQAASEREKARETEDSPGESGPFGPPILSRPHSSARPPPAGAVDWAPAV